MKLKTVFQTVQWANVLAAAAQIIGALTGQLPPGPATPYLLAIQAVIGAILPSLGGVTHQMAYGTPQDPNAKSKP